MDVTPERPTILEMMNDRGTAATNPSSAIERERSSEQMDAVGAVVAD
jgi:hypothetical protein